MNDSGDDSVGRVLELPAGSRRSKSVLIYLSHRVQGPERNVGFLAEASEIIDQSQL